MVRDDDIRSGSLEPKQGLHHHTIIINHPRTRGHLERVTTYAKWLADELHWSPDQLRNLEFGARLHDIGKVAIPDHILHKPGKLTDDEFEIMKQHTVIGGNLLYELYRKKQSVRLEVARDIVLYHHERFDGRGYPHGLKGKDIPLCARIMAVADVFDALSSERCYKPAFSREKCRCIIEEERGKHFDPVVVDAFLRQEDIFWKIRSKFPT
jgi:putative two-component system response regulator